MHLFGRLVIFLGGGGSRYASSGTWKLVRACEDCPLATPCASQTAPPATAPSCELLHCACARFHPSSVDADGTICVWPCTSLPITQPKNCPSVSVWGQAAGSCVMAAPPETEPLGGGLHVQCNLCAKWHVLASDEGEDEWAARC